MFSLSLAASVGVACIALSLASFAHAAEPARFKNPVVAGFAPDPSVCRVGDDYYLANSSFTMLPGLPIYHSRDLVNWRLIGHALAADGRQSFLNSTTNGGVYAPTLRHHAGTFYLIVKNTTSGKNELYTTRDPAGKWENPVAIGPDWDGDIDPDLFFDADGTAYVARRIGIGDGSKADQFAWRFDPKTARVTSDKIEIWPGTREHVWPEGGHLYRVGDFYYYLLAEGGTGPDHRVTIARKPIGKGLDDASQKWEPCPHNPILFNDPKTRPEVTTTGHADLVQDARGNWWAVFLAERPRPLPLLGRETFLAPVEWKDGWPIVNGGRPITPQMTAPFPLPGDGGATPTTKPSPRDDFDGPTLGLEWNWLRTFSPETRSLTERPGHLTLHGTADGLDSKATVAWAGRRLREKSARVTTVVDFAPTADGHYAGLNLFSRDISSAELIVRRTSGKREAVVVLRGEKAAKTSDAIALPDAGPVRLEMTLRDERVTFRCSTDDGTTWQTVQDVATNDAIASPGFAGLYVGVHAVGAGATAHFDWFEVTFPQ